MAAVVRWIGRQGLRVAAVAVFAALVLGLVPESVRSANAVLPRLSPILSLFGALAARQWLGWGTLLGVPLVVVSLFFGRVFCWRFCPMGFLAEMAGRLNPRGRTWCRRVPAVNRALALVVFVTAACGYPLFIWLDPLCIFNGFFAAWREPLSWTSAAIGALFVLVLLLAAAVPNVWCHKLCPLGGLQEVVMGWGRRLRSARRSGRGIVPAERAEERPPVLMGLATRRAVLASVPAVAAGLVARHGFGVNGARALRPPSADVQRINALCARCGNCMRACPYGLIHPDFGSTGIDGLLSPVIHFRSQNPDWDPDDDRYCFQDCVKCTEVCPTGALRPITVAEKRTRPIGRAVVIKDRCLAWAKGEYCAVCDEYCPYKAVKLEKRGEVNCPVIDPALCRGCGACEGACPAEPFAIVVRPVGV